MEVQREVWRSPAGGAWRPGRAPIVERGLGGRLFLAGGRGGSVGARAPLAPMVPRSVDGVGLQACELSEEAREVKAMGARRRRGRA